MMPAMNLPAMPQGAMMPGMPSTSGMGMPMMGMMPMMPQMMGGMMPQMMGGMMPHMMPMMGMPQMMPMMGMPQMMPMMGMMPGMATGLPMMCKMTVEMAKDGMVCKLMPMEGTTLEAMRERCDGMMKMLSAGVPVMMMCGGTMMMGTSAMPATTAMPAAATK